MSAATRESVKKLSIRTGAVRSPDKGYLLACDPKKEERDIAHTFFLKWESGTFSQGTFNFSADALCDVTVPKQGLVAVGREGEYGFISKGANHTGNVFKESAPKPSKKRFGNFRSIATIGGIAHAVGLRGILYRLERPDLWTRIDEGLPESFNGQALHGFSKSDIYAVGREGAIAQFDGKRWVMHDSPTNLILSAVACAPDGVVYVGGHKGMLLRGRNERWTAIRQSGTTDDIWDLEWFGSELFVSTLSGVYTLKGGELGPVDFGADPPVTTYQLSAAAGVLWSIGRSDVLAFDTKKWTRIV
jgi:hypothetical protein